MHQSLLRIALPEGASFWPDELRTAVARQDTAVAPLLMGRSPQGDTLDHTPVRFVGARTWIGVVADPGYQDALYAHVGPIIRAASDHLGRALPVEIESRELGIRASNTPVFYTAHNVALKRRGVSAHLREAEDLFAERLIASLAKQAAVNGLDCPVAEDLEVSNVHIERQMGMHMKVSGGRLVRERITLLPRVTFSMFAELEGYWFTGTLNSRGYGQIVKASHRLRGQQ